MLLKFAGLIGVSNVVTNPAGFSEHVDVRVVVVAGSNGLNLDATNRNFSDDHGGQHTVFLSAINLATVQRRDLWVAADGATYLGTSGARRNRPPIDSWKNGCC